MTGEAMLSATRALCNVCGALVDAKVVERGGAVYLVKWCGSHGRTEALVSADAEWYRASLAYVKPGTEPLARAVADYQGCPDSCGLCPMHEQHTCVPIIEITGRCDLDCPVCLLEHRQRLPELSVEAMHQVVDALVRYEGRVNMLTLSGGEPTSHPRFLEIVEAAQRPEIGILSVSTNGLRLARDDTLLRALIDRQVVISLQYDGDDDRAWTLLRGRALAATKRRLIDRILELGGRLSLTLTLARGINEQALQGVLALLFEHDQIVSVMVQPAAYVGQAARRLPELAEVPITIPEVVDRLAAASGSVLARSDFSPLPCSHPACFALTYLLRLESGALVPLPRIVDHASYLDIIKNQALMGTDLDALLKIKDALYELWSSDGRMPDRDAILATVRRLLLQINALDRDATVREVLEVGVRNIKSVFIHHFMDRATFDLSRVIKCCNHYPQIDGRLIPACVRNNITWGGSTWGGSRGGST